MSIPQPKPKFARFTSDGNIIKDHHFYAGTDSRWNRPSAMNEKYYPYFHLQNDLNKERLEKLIEEQAEENKIIENYRREYQAKLREETLARHKERIRERRVIQAKSSQFDEHTINVEYTNQELLDIVAKRLNSQKFSRFQDISWNYFDKASPKRIRQAIMPISLKGEVDTIEGIKKKIAEEERIKEEEALKKVEFRKKQRKVFLEKQEQNSEFSKKAGLPLVKSVRSLTWKEGTESTECSPILKRSSTNLSIPSLAEPSSPGKLRFPSITSIGRISPSPSISNHLGSKSKSLSENELQKALYLASPELKGMLIKNMERGAYDSTNPYHKSLAETNPVFKQVQEESSMEKQINSNLTRGSSLLSLSPKLRKRSSIKSLSPMKERIEEESEERKKAFGDMESFEKTKGSTIKVQGYSRISLDEVNRIYLNNGTTSPQELQEIQMKKLSLDL